MTLSNDEIVELIDRYDRESKAIKSELLKICWYMRGGLTYTEAIQLSPSEREIIANIIESNLKTTEKTKMPFF